MYFAWVALSEIDKELNLVQFPPTRFSIDINKSCFEPGHVFASEPTKVVGQGEHNSRATSVRAASQAYF